MRALLVAVALPLVLAGCASGIVASTPVATPSRTLGPGEHWLPVRLDRQLNGVPVACGGVGWVGSGHVLTGSPNDPRYVWMMADGQRADLEWPVGWSARFDSQLELLDQFGVVVGREGTSLAGGCEMAPGIWWVDVPCLSNDYRDVPGAAPSLPFCTDLND